MTLLRQRYRKSLVCLLVNTALVFSPTAVYANQNSAPSASAKDWQQFGVESLKSVDQVSFLYAAAGVSTESIRIIENDLKHHLGSTPFPQIILKNNGIHINGRASGVRIVNYEPLTIEYRGQTWTYNKASAVDINYFELSKFLRGGAKTSALSLLLTEAHAAEKDPLSKSLIRLGTVLGAAIAATAVGVVVLFSAPVSIGVLAGTMAVAALLGGWGGATAGRKFADSGQTSEPSVVTKILQGPHSLSCSGETLAIDSKAATSKASIKFKKKGPPPAFQFFDDAGAQVSEKKIPSEQMNELKKLAANCNSNVDAEAIMSSYRQATQKLAQQKPPPDPSRPSTKAD